MGSSAKRVTIRDVAAAAGVSVTTVSDSLAGKGRLPEATRVRVVREAERLGYRASSAARNLVRGRTGVLLMSASGPDAETAMPWNVEFFVRLMSGASEYAFRHGYALAMAPADSTLGERQIACDGVLVVDPTPRSELSRRALQENLPMVTIGRLGEHEAFVDNDIQQLCRSLLDRFQEQGAAAPSLLSGPLDTSYTSDAHAAYLTWCTERDVRPVIRIIPAGDERQARDAAEDLLRDNETDAVVCTLDVLAKSVMAAADALGIGVPAECLVASLSDSAAMASAAVPVTAADLQPDAMGQEAARMLIGLVESRAVPQAVVIPGRVHWRASTARAS